MPFRKPVSTLGGLNFWSNIKQDENFVMQKHKTGIWPYKFRIILRTTGQEIANASDLNTIEHDWSYLQSNAIPRASENGLLDVNKLFEELIKQQV